MKDVLGPVLGFDAVITEGPDELEFDSPLAGNDDVAQLA
jgi:hypothetical protein